VSFVREDGSPRPWTVFVGENGTCKTTLLRTIAIAAAGGAFANHLVNDPKAYVDRRRGHSEAIVAAGFGFSRTQHDQRTYPFRAVTMPAPPEVGSLATVTSTDVTVRANYSTWATREETRHLNQAPFTAFARKWAVRPEALAEAIVDSVVHPPYSRCHED
jgi:nitrate/nitrite transporter NarK